MGIARHLNRLLDISQSGAIGAMAEMVFAQIMLRRRGMGIARQMT